MTTHTIVETREGPRAVNASPDLLRELLAELGETTRSVGCDLGELLRPGLQVEEVAQRLSAAGLEPEPEVMVWFGWHDGPRDPTAAGQLLPSAPLSTLERSLHDREIHLQVNSELHSMYGTGSVGRGIDGGWLPLVHSTHGLAVDCGTDRSTPPGIRNFDDDFYDDYSREQGLMVGVSLCTPVIWWIEEIQSGAAVWNAQTGSWKVDQTRGPATKQRSLFA